MPRTARPNSALQHQPRTLLGACLVVGLLTSCATGSRFNRLTYGMTKGQVLATIGEPDRTSHDSKIETWRFSYAPAFSPTVFRTLKFNLDGELIAWD